MPPHDSAARLYPALARFVEAEARLGDAMAARGPAWAGLYEFLRFGVKQAWACLFGGLMVGLLIGTYLLYPKDAALARYDFLFLASLAIQAALLALRLETWEEARVIATYHAVGTAMEIFKTAVGSWIYPEEAFFRMGGVPLFTGFMYAAVGSYIVRAWRLFDFRFTRHPPLWAVAALGVAIYVNFFAHHYVADLRLALFAGAVAIFGRSWIHFKPWRAHRRMPLLLACGLAALFIWIAENVGTLTGTWLYPNQMRGWTMVSLGKLGSWYLLLIISYALVCLVHRPQAPDEPDLAPAPAASRRASPAQ